MREHYTAEYYAQQRTGAHRSALEIVPLVIDLVGPRSVVDVGCGLGVWLAVFREHGVDAVLGIDGDHIDRQRLEIPQEHFLAADLEAPPAVDRRFDLAVSLEVAEHLRPECAQQFVTFLTALAPVVLFSAAIPFQDGTAHINEQWPDYWTDLFRRQDYVVVDCLRRRIWQNANVRWWYAQNLLLFARTADLANYPALAREQAGGGPLAIVHPKKYLKMVEALVRANDPENPSESP